MKIVIASTGYDGLFNAVLLAQYQAVVAYDIVPQKLGVLSRKVSPIVDAEIKDYLHYKMLNFRATLYLSEVYEGDEFVFIRSGDKHLQYEVGRGRGTGCPSHQPAGCDGHQVHRTGWLYGKAQGRTRSWQHIFPRISAQAARPV